MWSNRTFLPHLLGNDYWDMFDYPENVLGQDFGLGAIEYPRQSYGGGRYGVGGGYRGSDLIPFDSNQGFSNVQNDKEKFAVNLACNQFTPEEVNVTVDDQNNQLLIHGKHEERSDEHGHVSREFRRRYALPKDVQLDKVDCNWNNGVLSIVAPKKPQQPAITQQGRRLPIQMSQQHPQRGQHQRGQSDQQFPIRGSLGQQGQIGSSQQPSQTPTHHPAQPHQQPTGKQEGQQQQTQPPQATMRG